MMKVAVLSDTHDNTPAIVWIIEYLNEHQIPVALHAGDLINPGVVGRFIQHYTGKFHFVFGNNDGEQARSAVRAHESQNTICHIELMKLELDGRKIFMNHYSDISEEVAKSEAFDIAIGGHDHQY